jgi:hypothetical protein
MLFTSNDSLQLINTGGTPVSLDFSIRYETYNVATGLVNFSTNEGNISTNTTTVIMPAPASGNVNEVTFISIYNNNAGVQTVKLGRYNGANTYLVGQASGLQQYYSLKFQKSVGFQLFNDLGAPVQYGFTGATGTQGVQGATGLSGSSITGATGPNIVGATGSQGTVGLTGSTGPLGASGPGGVGGTITITANNANINLFPTMVAANTGNQAPYVDDAGLYFNPLANTLFVGGGVLRRIFSNAAVIGNTTINWATCDEARLTLTGSANIFFSGANDGQACVIRMTQGGSGGYTANISANNLVSNVRYSTTLSSYTGTTTLGATDRLGFMYNADKNTYDFVAVIYNIG